MSYPELKMLIAGDWVVGGAGKSEPVFCPADGSEIGQVPHATTSDLDRALESSLEGFNIWPVSYTHLRAHETVLDLVCRLLLEKKK